MLLDLLGEIHFVCKDITFLVIVQKNLHILRRFIIVQYLSVALPCLKDLLFCVAQTIITMFALQTRVPHLLQNACRTFPVRLNRFIVIGRLSGGN